MTRNSTSTCYDTSSSHDGYLYWLAGWGGNIICVLNIQRVKSQRATSSSAPSQLCPSNIWISEVDAKSSNNKYSILCVVIHNPRINIYLYNPSFRLPDATKYNCCLLHSRMRRGDQKQQSFRNLTVKSTGLDEFLVSIEACTSSFYGGK